MDSTLAALELADEGYELHALSVRYDGRPRAEAVAARRVARALPFATRHEVRIDGLAIGPPPGAPRGRASLEGVIAHRNLVFWALAANRAATVGARTLAAGHTRADGRTYTDASPLFFRRLTPLLGRTGVGRLDGDVEIRLPLQERPLAYWRRVVRRHADVIDRTRSCWRDGRTPCGTCFACVQRERFLATV